MLQSVELFSGAGGLAMGMSIAGFEHALLAERDKWACETVERNKSRNLPIVQGWNLKQGDVREIDFSELKEKIDVVAGGPPCQPFSLGGKHRGRLDDRDMFPVSVDVVRRLRPKAFIFENVKGLKRSTFSRYFDYIKLQLTYPELQRRHNEDWPEHHERLQRHFTDGSQRGLTYQVLDAVLDAADFGVPQRRHRVFIVGFRRDVPANWSFPNPTHSFDALVEDKWVTGDYWDRHELSASERVAAPDSLHRKISHLRQANMRPMLGLSPWRTVRDALNDLPEPIEESVDGEYQFHRFQPGARSYKGHTGSPLDHPAKALKAGDHGVPGGENMMVLRNGDVRYFTVREAARLQTFPDSYHFHGSWTETMRQLGNAVPVKLAHVIAKSVAEHLLRAEEKATADMIRRLAR